MKRVKRKFKNRGLSIFLLTILLIDKCIAQLPKPELDMNTGISEGMEKEMNIIIFVIIVLLTVTIIYFIKRYNKRKSRDINYWINNDGEDSIKKSEREYETEVTNY